MGEAKRRKQLRLVPKAIPDIVTPDIVITPNRSASDLIAELKEHAASGRYNIGVSLVVAKDNGDEVFGAMVHAERGDPLARLNELVRKGGTPVGFAGCWTTPVAGGRVMMEMEGWLLDEYKGDDRAEKAIEAVLAGFADRLQEKYK